MGNREEDPLRAFCLPTDSVRSQDARSSAAMSLIVFPPDIHCQLSMQKQLVNYIWKGQSLMSVERLSCRFGHRAGFKGLDLWNTTYLLAVNFKCMFVLTTGP